MDSKRYVVFIESYIRLFQGRLPCNNLFRKGNRQQWLGIVTFVFERSYGAIHDYCGIANYYCLLVEIDEHFKV